MIFEFTSPDTSMTLDFLVGWTPGSDALAGVKSYQVKVKENTGVWNDWISDTSATSATFTGESNKTYYFEAAAKDSAGNIENFTGMPECSTYVIQVGAEEAQQGKKEFKIAPNPFYSSVDINLPVEKAHLNIYDVSGRLVDRVQVEDYKAKWGEKAPKGIYFAKPGELNGRIEVKNGVWKLIKL